MNESKKRSIRKKVNENYSPDINPSNLNYDLLDDVYAPNVSALVDSGMRPSDFKSDWERTQDKSEDSWQNWLDNNGVYSMTPQQVYVLLVAIEKKVIEVKSFYYGQLGGFVVKKSPSYITVLNPDGDAVVIISQYEVNWDIEYIP